MTTCPRCDAPMPDGWCACTQRDLDALRAENERLSSQDYRDTLTKPLHVEIERLRQWQMGMTAVLCLAHPGGVFYEDAAKLLKADIEEAERLRRKVDAVCAEMRSCLGPSWPPNGQPGGRVARWADDLGKEQP